MTLASPGWTIDPDDPRAPPREVWERLTEAQREAVVDALPSWQPEHMRIAPEGDHHSGNVDSAKTALRRWFRKDGPGRRDAYVGSDLNVYYPGEQVFAPDVFVVLDVDPGPRERWAVQAEGNRGLDVVVEVHVAGKRAKDLERNPALYARLGIPEYFCFDARRLRLFGWRLTGGGNAYQRVVPQAGLLASRVLGLNLGIGGRRLRLYAGRSLVLDSDDWIDELSRAIDSANERAEEEARRAEEEARRADANARLVAELQARLRELEES